MPIHELAGLTLGLRDVFGPPGDELEEQLFDAADQRPVQVALLNAFFLQRVAVGRYYALVMHVAADIEQQRGCISITELSHTYGYSVRTLDRLFQQVIGLPPKFYARTVRLQSVLNCLVRHPTVRWADIVASHGYYDQPHFIKELVTFTGMQPEAYRAHLARFGMSAPPNHVQFLQDNFSPKR